MMSIGSPDGAITRSYRASLNGFREVFGYVPSTINRLCSGVVGNTPHIRTLAKRQRAPIRLALH
jgi:hypothetical protein